MQSFIDSTNIQYLTLAYYELRFLDTTVNNEDLFLHWADFSEEKKQANKQNRKMG